MATKRDYYEVLGLTRSATDDDIKRAFKRLAMKYHPDRNKEADAGERFREINEAYQVLSDPNKRQAYDAGGFDAVDGSRGGGYDPFGGSADFADIFSQFFGDLGGGGGGGGRRRGESGPAMEAGRDLRIVVRLTLEEAVRGITKEIKINTLNACPDCGGKGSKTPNDKTVCSACNGNGIIIQSQGFFRVQRTCDKCHGDGAFYKNPCKKCHGSGRIQSPRTVSITIPPGLDSGQFVTLAGQGEAGLHGGPAGDLIAVVQIEEHNLFKRDGDNLYCDVPISFADAALGGRVTVPTLDGKLSITVAPGTQTGTTYRLPNKGIQPPIPNRPRGHLFCTVVVETPVGLTEYQKDLLYKFQQSMDGEAKEDSSKKSSDKAEEKATDKNTETKDTNTDTKDDAAFAKIAKHMPRFKKYSEDIANFFKKLR